MTSQPHHQHQRVCANALFELMAWSRPRDAGVATVAPGKRNEARDWEIKLALYSRRGVREHWIVDWRQWTVATYRHDGTALRLAASLTAQDTLESPHLPGFSCPISRLFAGLPPAPQPPHAP